MSMSSLVLLSAWMCGASGPVELDVPLPTLSQGEGLQGMLARSRMALEADPEPSSGLGLLIPGAIMTGVGALNLLSATICVADFYRDYVGRTGTTWCLIGSIGVGVGLLGAGIPMTIIGTMRRTEHKAWEERQRLAALDPSRLRMLPPVVSYDPGSGATLLAWGMGF
jgi:hypothetical protein